jgi:PPK2 family polyphosphate:nucleotide phosphotransferase
MNYRNKFVVEPGARVKLDEIDPSFTGEHDSQETAMPKITANIARMETLQYLLYANGEQSVLVVLQALDAAGTDGAASVFSFKQPSHYEAAHDFLWRIHQRVPGKGEVVIFNRSHYEDVLVARVHKLIEKSVWSKRYDMINDFEKMLSNNGTRILKFFLHISPEEQLKRFKKRLDDPSRQWKITESDYSERELWPKYMEAYEDVLERTSTDYAPWYVIPANHKWFRNVAISDIIADTLEEMGLKAPSARVDIEKIRQMYDIAEQKQDMNGNGSKDE